MKSNAIQLVADYTSLHEKEKKTKEDKKKLNKLRSALKIRGLDPTSRDLHDMAIILDNRPQVEGYIQRADDAEMHYAKRSNGKNEGKIKANTIEASALKVLGLSTTDPRRLKAMLSTIAITKKAAEKSKSTHARRINNGRIYRDQQYNEFLREFGEEEEPTEEYVESTFDPEEITAFAAKAFASA